MLHLVQPEKVFTTRLVMLDEYARLIMGLRLLTSKKRPGDPDFFGGKRNNGETSVQCAIRETSEETGMVISADKISHLHTEIDSDGNKIFIRDYYLYDEWASVDQISSLPEHIGAVCLSRYTALALTKSVPHRRAIYRVPELAVA